jgi:hypothetical protein
MAALVVLAVVLLACSPGKPRPCLDGDEKRLSGGISEKSRISINGVEQGTFIRDRDTAGPACPGIS